VNTAAEIRGAIVAEATRWVGTPWHHRARVRGAGVDCAQFLVGVFCAPSVAQVPALDLGYYPPDWHLHQDRPRFLLRLAEYAEPLPAGEPGLPGDIAMFKYGRHAAHGSIVIEWPLIVHAFVKDRSVTTSDAVRDADLARRFAGFWRLKTLSPLSSLLSPGEVQA
jgi:hypothetical protein